MKTRYKIDLIIILFAVFFPLAVFYPSVACSGTWSVSPIMLDLGKAAKSGVITVTNEDENELLVQVTAAEWTQDAQGKDVYEETNNVIFFPKILKFEKKEEKIIRVGIKIPAVAVEKTYRLFIQEIPKPSKAEGVNVGISLKFGVPVFVKPLTENIKGEIEKVGMSKGVLETMIRNSGNEHFRISTIILKGKNAKGEEIFSKEIGGWYLLSGASRLDSVEIPHDVCPDIAKISVEVKTDKFSLNGMLDADKTMCLP